MKIKKLRNWKLFENCKLKIENYNLMNKENNKLEIGKLDFHNTDIIVLIDKTFNLSNITGEKINGILGSDILEDYIVEINYQTNRINFFEHSKFESPLINAIFQKVEKLIISGFLFVSFFASNIVTIICIL